MKNWLKNIGPGPLVAAAFIGPGTVTVCTLAGVSFGYSLLWAMVFSIIATVVLQEMAARLGLVSQKGLAEVIKQELKHPLVKYFAVLLVLSAIVAGNAAYESGNISGSVLGLEVVFGSWKGEIFGLSVNILSIISGLVAFSLLYFGNYKTIERILIVLVIIMSMAFVTAAILTKPSLVEILKGVFTPSITSASLLTIIALIGTTVVPYNLFLHAALVKEKWNRKDDLKYAKKDTLIAVVLGGLVSMSIIICAASVGNIKVESVIDLATGLEPLFGSFSKYFLATGLIASGITSALTAPLAASYVACECFGWKKDMKSAKFRAVWMFILLVGIAFSSLGVKPIEIIKFAQVTNGVLLPIIVAFLIWVVNKTSVLGSYTNSKRQNIFSILILLISILLSITSLNKVFQLNLF